MLLYQIQNSSWPFPCSTQQVHIPSLPLLMHIWTIKTPWDSFGSPFLCLKQFLGISPLFFYRGIIGSRAMTNCLAGGYYLDLLDIKTLGLRALDIFLLPYFIFPKRRSGKLPEGNSSELQGFELWGFWLYHPVIPPKAKLANFSEASLFGFFSFLFPCFSWTMDWRTIIVSSTSTYQGGTWRNYRENTWHSMTYDTFRILIGHEWYLKWLKNDDTWQVSCVSTSPQVTSTECVTYVTSEIWNLEVSSSILCNFPERQTNKVLNKWSFKVSKLRCSGASGFGGFFKFLPYFLQTLNF